MFHQSADKNHGGARNREVFMLFDAIARQEGYLYALRTRAPPLIAAIRRQFGGNSAEIQWKLGGNLAAVRRKLGRNS